MPTLPADSVDSIVTDPPYGLSFMGKDWDHGVPGVHFWAEALRVAKPGAFLLAFGGTRTFHRLAVAIEDAGWEIRDTVMWVYGSGFPKSLDVGKAIDKAAGAEREIVGRRTDRAATPKRDIRGGKFVGASVNVDLSAITAPATDAAREWDGWGTALKPALEPITVARKPLIGTVAENVLAHGTGGLNIDGCRVGVDGGTTKGNPPKGKSNGVYGNGINGACDVVDIGKGRWPANLIHDGSDEVLAGFPNGGAHGVGDNPKEYGVNSLMELGIKSRTPFTHNDTGSAARFFYCAKASKADREGSTHPTMKPTTLMRYLVKLVTRRGGVVLDPFMGSGSTGKACAFEGMEFIGIDLSPEYCEIAARRIAAVVQPTPLPMRHFLQDG